MPSLYYLRTQDGLEVDLVIELNQKLNFCEIKSGATITPGHASSLLRAKRDLGNLVQTSCIISCAHHSFPLQKDIYNYRWQDILVLKISGIRFKEKQVCLFPIFFRILLILSIPVKSLFYDIRVCSC